MRQKGKKVGTIEQGKWERKYRDEEDPSWYLCLVLCDHSAEECDGGCIERTTE